MGATNPTITIVEFGDFQCPYCQQEYQIIRRVVSQYPEVKLIFRDFPISASHPDALGAALAANCAFEQNKFWEYHDLLYNNQTELTIENFLLFAQDLKLNFDQFSQCLADQKYLNEIQNDLMDGVKLEITGTPTFFVNGYKISGVIPYETWVEILERYKLINKTK
jgi:protein-disulfide isomerase